MKMMRCFANKTLKKFQFWIVFILLACILIIFFFTFAMHLKTLTQNTNYVDEHPNSTIKKTVNESKVYHSFMASAYKNYEVYNVINQEKKFNGNVNHLLKYNQDSYKISAWKNETVYAQIVMIHSAKMIEQMPNIIVNSSVKQSDDFKIDIAPIKKMLAVKNRNNPTLTSQPQEIGDWIQKEHTNVIMADDEVYALWLTCHVASNAAVGEHSIEIDLNSTAKGVDIRHVHHLEINVKNQLMPSLNKQSEIQPEFWQNPNSINNYYNHALNEDVQLNSEKYWSYQDPYLKYLSAANVKVYTLRLMEWVHVSYDVQTDAINFRFIDGVDLASYLKHVLSFNFTTIQLLFPDPLLGYNSFCNYLNQNKIKVSDEIERISFNKLQQFITDFFSGKNWYNLQRPVIEIAFDELPVAQLEKKLALFDAFNGRKIFKLATTVNYQFWSAHDENVLYRFDDLSISYEYTEYTANAKSKIIAFADKRTQAGKITSVYSCTADYPANFIKSQPGESALIWFYGFKNHINGFLRWSFTYWPTVWHNPETIKSGDDAAFNLETGDLFLVYPRSDSAPGVDDSLRMDMIMFGEEQMVKIQSLLAQKIDMHRKIDDMIKDIHWPNTIKPHLNSFVYYTSAHFNAIDTLATLVALINSF